MDWIWIAALVWAAVSLPLALVTGRYLRRSDERDAARDRYLRRFPAAASVRSVHRLAAGSPRRSGRARTPGLTAGPVAPSQCRYRASAAPQDHAGPDLTTPDPATGRTPAKASGESRGRSRFYRHL